MQHGTDWLPGVDLAGWIISEKFDGCRAYWTGAELWTKSGRQYRNVPGPTLATLQRLKTPLDCELCVPDAPRRESLQAARRAALQGVWAPELRLMAFDIPSPAQTAIERRWALDRILGTSGQVAAAPWFVAESTEAALQYRAELIAHGREGAMALDPGSYYALRRVGHLRKLK